MDGDRDINPPGSLARDLRGTILVVEDEQLMLRLLKRSLSNQGYDVFTAADGEEAIEVYHTHKQDIDVGLVDIGLPNIGGADVFLKMKEENPAVRVVVASGYLDPEVRAEMFQGGVKHFFSKPYILQDIVNAFEKLMAAR